MASDFLTGYGSDFIQVSRLPLPPSGALSDHMQAPARAFDTSQELFWTGDEYGRVSSFYGRDLRAYTSYKAGTDPVRQFLFHDKGVISVGGKSVHMASRRGLFIWHITNEYMKDLRCMSYTSKGTSEILVAGLQDQMFVIDVDKGIITKQVPTTDHYKIMRRSRYLCAATQTGSVNILDPLNFSLIKTWQAHTSLINDMDAQHDFIVTCGFSLRQQQTYMLDPLVNVFDLKKMVALPPIPFPPGAAFVRMHPRMLTTSIVVSQTGQMHIVDLMNVNTSNVRQANVLTALRSLEIAPSGEAIALSDIECNVHIWGSPTRLRFAELSTPTEFADPDEKPTHTEWSNDTPLSTVGMPYYREQLLSAWPSHMIFEVGAPPLKVDSSFLISPKATEWAIYGRNARKGLRNQVENTRISEKASAAIPAPKFLSEKAREADTVPEWKISDLAEATGLKELPSLKAQVDPLYRNVEIKYSKYGVDDFDFGFYNNTPYSGLETHISNSYANPLLQLMRFTPLLRNLALQHTATNCINDSCLLCEMGFLFDMLEKAEGTACQATNLLKTFSHDPQAGPMGLLEEDSRGASLTNMLQQLDRFLLEKMSQDYRSIHPYSNALGHALSTSATTTIRCVACKSEHTRPGNTVYGDLIYPQPSLKPHNRNGRAPIPKRSFSEILKSSIEREGTNRGWCMTCRKYQTVQTKKTIHSAPAVLMLNACVVTPEAKQFWATPGCLPEEIGVIISQGQIFCYQGEDLRLHLQRGAHNITVYSLVGLAAEIDSGQHEKPHLVSLINVSHSAQTAPGESQWYLFNDFLVSRMSTEEALTFNTTWKVPSVITYQVKDYNNRVDNTWKRTLDTSILYQDNNNRFVEKTYRTLTEREAPTEGTIIALDAEFVSVRQPEIEVNSDGERETIRPTAHALARVSVLRGSGDDEGLPFIDDYIIIKEPIVDYLTAYSGIKPGDLDPRTSRHNLVSLKIAYKKLWILLNLGCRFLGHGLKTDFRVINIYIPKSQVIDTIHYFFMKNQPRRLGLAFLSWYLFREDIQVETHDSIEDAKMALRLWRKYEEYVDAGVLEEIIREIYKVGSGRNFKPPNLKREREGGKEVPTGSGGGGGEIARSDTPPEGGGAVGNSNAAGGGGGGGVEGPVTPVRRPLGLGLAPGTGGSSGFGGGGGGWTPGKGSPLR
ncbi:poly(A)-specific ribonuclease [Clarireedia jacksonii]